MSDPTASAAAAPTGSMTFEFPCNERMRSFLRIESLFKRFAYFSRKNSSHDHQAALWSFFELLDLVGGRGDVKSELLQELDRQRARLTQFAGRPGVSQKTLEKLLGRIQQIFNELSSANTRLGPHIAEHEWLQVLKGRFGIPGGICEFDVPSLHVWLHRPSEVRQAMLETWLMALRPIFEGVEIVLKLLREGTPSESQLATRGYFELSMDGRQIQIIRVLAPRQPEVVAEISANKYVVSVRFRQLEPTMHLKPTEQDIPFELTLCNF